MPTAVVFGANRGIGLGFVDHYLNAGYHVIATYRDEATLGRPTAISEEREESLLALQQRYPGLLSLYPLEVTDEAAVEKMAQTLGKVDLLILNAGIKGYPVSGTRPKEHTSEHLAAALRVNTQAPDHIIRSFFPLLSETENACVVYMSSLVGRTADNSGGGYHPYRISKAAANALVWNWSIELMAKWKERAVKPLTKTPCAFAICPGWVRTDMGGPSARLSVGESTSEMAKVIEHVVQTKKSNALYMYDKSVAEPYVIPPVLQEIFDEKARESLPSSSGSSQESS